MGLSVIWCPSDGAIQGLRYTFPASYGLPFDNPALTQPMCYSSYAGCLGTWTYFPINTGVDQLQESLMNGMFQYIGMSAGINPVPIYGTPYPNSGAVSPVKIATITDGLSNTIAWSEHAHGLFSQTADSKGTIDFYCWNWWVSANCGDTMFTVFYPINPQRKISTGYGDTNHGDAMVLSSSSFHPGGANFGFADGSVRFLKDSIQSWQLVGTGATLVPNGWTMNANGTFTATGANAQLGIYQKLGTRNGGEVLSSDAY